MVARDIGVAATGFGVEPSNQRQRRLQLLIVDLKGFENIIVVVIGHAVKALVHNTYGHSGIGIVVLHAVQLQGKALLKAACPHSGRVHLLNDVQHLLHLVGIDLEALRKSQVVGDKVDTAAHITGIVQRANNFLGYGLLSGGKMFHGELLEQIVEKRGFGNIDGFALVNILVALLSLAIAVVVIVGIHTHQALIVVISVVITFGERLHSIVRLRRNFKHRIFLQFFFQPLLQRGDGQLNHLHQQKLLGGEFLFHLHRLSLSGFHSCRGFNIVNSTLRKILS